MKADTKSKESIISGKVVNVADGDTITILSSQNRQTKVLLYRIDASEKAQDFGNISRKHLANLVAGKEIAVTAIDIDQYGRAVGRINIGEKDIAEELLKSGMA